MEGFIAAVIGTVLGGYAADQMKTRDAASAATRAVDRHFHEAALTAGGTSIDAPRERPEFRPGFYSTCVTDPTGMLVEALYRDPEPISRDDG